MVFCDATDYFTFKPEGYEVAKRELDRYLIGYEKHCKFTEAEKAAFFDMIAIRHYQLQATVIEICGLDSVDGAYLDRQLDWLMKWREQCQINESSF
jgi:Ser/Thr protein kinase RdoA (MazF antagonist)